MSQGLKRWEQRLKNIPKTVRARVREAIHQGAAEIVSAQKRLAPVRTGKLRDSITATIGGQAPKYSQFGRMGGKGDADLTAVITVGNSEVRYAHLVEFGSAPHIAGGRFKGADHPGTTAQPFFYPGYRMVRRRVKSRITRAVNKGIKEA
ncbi:MAG TPA: HK97-gp10 family putative phage morphogenesis protein [Microvirga sp.]|nr:HK97-gp10 family putative phage morphogenesis protein [Microvirga sp.]